MIFFIMIISKETMNSETATEGTGRVSCQTHSTKLVPFYVKIGYMNGGSRGRSFCCLMSNTRLFSPQYERDAVEDDILHEIVVCEFNRKQAFDFYDSRRSYYGHDNLYSFGLA